MFVVEILKSAFNDDNKQIKEQGRSTRYFDNIDDAMTEYATQYEYLLDIAPNKSYWDIIVISIFGNRELLKMQTIRCEKEK